MPYGVTKFPHAGDPRLPTFAIAGMEYGSAAPWKFRASTVGALPPFDVFNGDGFILDPSIILPGETHWQYNGSTGIANIELIAYGWRDLQPTPVPHSLYVTLNVGGTSAPYHFGEYYATFPDAITGWQHIALHQSSGPTNYFPNPMTLRPMKWDTPIAP